MNAHIYLAKARESSGFPILRRLSAKHSGDEKWGFSGKCMKNWQLALCVSKHRQERQGAKQAVP